MKELVVISGKGGTGKTSIAASFAALAKSAVMADCDVDAADLHLILQPQRLHQEEFYGGYKARIKADKCNQCGSCYELCRFDAVIAPDNKTGSEETLFKIDPVSCEGCGVCANFCPDDAIVMEQPVSGEFYISNTRYGALIHAKLGIAAENSGKLVALVRKNARQLSQKNGHDLVIIDGSPGIGCPVVSSITGTDLALIVTEPTVSGIHDLDRICELTGHFHIPACICINKWDLNPEMTDKIKQTAEETGIPVAGMIRYDNLFTKAQLIGASVVEYSGGVTSGEIKELWKHVSALLKN